MRPCRFALALALVGSLVAAARPAGADGSGVAKATGSARDPSSRPRLLFFWGVGCPHCEEAKPFVRALAGERSDVDIEWIEVRQDPAGRERFRSEAARLRIEPAGVPTFVVGDRYVVGFWAGASEREIRALLDVATAPRPITLPLVGTVDPARVPFPIFTLLIGLVDGINPCAMWVLLVMLGVLVRARSRARIALFGGTFVVMSGVVYFLFMTAWVGLFTLTAGLSRGVTIALGVVLVAMGLINLKEIVWFRRGPSLMVPDRAKPGLFRRMRAVAGAASLPAAMIGIAGLAFVVNLIELGCTLGLPAVYTRLLTLRQTGAGARIGWLALYNAAYVVPLALIVVIYAATLHRLTIGERGAKVLKGVSGALLVVFGLVFLLAPGVLER